MTFWYRQSPNPLFAQAFFGPGAVGRRAGAPRRSRDGHDRDGLGGVGHDGAARAVRSGAAGEECAAAERKDAGLGGIFCSQRIEYRGVSRGRARVGPAGANGFAAGMDGNVPARPDIPIRVEAAAFHGQPVYYRMIFPWTKPGRDTETDHDPAAKDSVGADRVADPNGICRWRGVGALEY